MGLKIVALLSALMVGGSPAAAATYPPPVEGDHIIKNFRFATGEVLPELRIHYRTIGTPKRDQAGVVRNAVLILHGTSGTSAGFLEPTFAGQLFEQGQLLDGNTHFIILPDANRFRPVEQAERRLAREISALRLRRHDPGAAQPARRKNSA
jgi:homoserine O-acetyltransferase